MNQERFGGNLICGYSHLAGQLVGICANAGPITAADAQKGKTFDQPHYFRSSVIYRALVFLLIVKASTTHCPTISISLSLNRCIYEQFVLVQM